MGNPTGTLSVIARVPIYPLFIGERGARGKRERFLKVLSDTSRPVLPVQALEDRFAKNGIFACSPAGPSTYCGCKDTYLPVIYRGKGVKGERGKIFKGFIGYLSARLLGGHSRVGVKKRGFCRLVPLSPLRGVFFEKTRSKARRILRRGCRRA